MREGQRKLHSWAETLLNIGSGFVISFLTWQYVASPLFDIPTGHSTALNITLLFTVVSVIRSYAWRRIFNWLHVRSVL